MPRLDQDIKLDFKDVLFRPKRSTLKSRSEVCVHTSLPLASLTFLQVDLHREFVFRNSKGKYNGIPMIASNMDTVGTFEMAKVFHKVDLTQLVVLIWRNVLSH